VALAVISRFIIDLRVGPRTLEVAKELVGSVALCCPDGIFPLLLMDEHLPYPKAILEVFGLVKHRRRQKAGRGRLCKPVLKPPPGLLAGVVRKVRDGRGNLLEVTTHALFGRLRDIKSRIRKLRIGRQINTSHLERLNGTLRSQQTRLARRTRNVSRLASMLQWALLLWRDIYNWVRPHGSLDGRCPAMALGLTGHVWSILEYVRYPTHVSDFQRQDWAEQRKMTLESALDVYLRKKRLPT